MATLADYQTLSDGRFTLAGNVTSKTLKFAVPSNFVFGTNKAKPVLAFKITPEDNIQLKIDVNHRNVMGSTNFNKSHTRGHWTIFSATTAFPEGSSFPDDVDVTFFCNSGKVHIDDVVIWYQVNE